MIDPAGIHRLYYHAAAISMEPFSPFSAHRLRLQHNPNVLKGLSDRRNTGTVEQTLGTPPIDLIQLLLLPSVVFTFLLLVQKYETSLLYHVAQMQ